MPATFSINLGQLTESTRKDNIFSVLNDIQDNTQKLISPRDVRDAFLSTWANTPFKITTPNNLANLEYIGIDSSNPSNRDIKKRILIGKRGYGGLDIINSSLLNSTDADIFLFNTKPDTATASQNSTKIAILAGTNSILYPLAPYIESKSNNIAIDLNIINPVPEGVINIFSQTGRVYINDIAFPTVAETSASASNGRILRYKGAFPNGYLKWEEPSITLNTIGTPGYPTNIYGSTVSVNGYPIEFINSDIVPEKIGGIEMGSSFSSNSFNSQNWPITEVLRDLLYPYTKPILEISVANTLTNTVYAEVGKTASAILTWKLTTFQRNVSEKIFNYQITPNTSYVGLSFSGLPGAFTGGTISVATYSNTMTSEKWTLTASDTFSHSATASLEFVYPIYYGFTNSIITNISTFNSIVNNLTKLIKPYPGIGGVYSLPFNGEGYLYFIHHNDYTWVDTDSKLKIIKDPNDFIIHNFQAPLYSGFTSSIINDFRVWRTKYTCAYPGANSNASGEFKFIF